MSSTKTKLDLLFEESSDLNQLLFFNPNKVGPAEKNPLGKKDLWDKYISLAREINTLVPEEARVSIIVVTTIKYNLFYQEKIMVNEEYDLRMMQINSNGRTIVATERLN